MNFHGHLTSALWPSSVSGNCDKFQEIYFWVVETLRHSHVSAASSPRIQQLINAAGRQSCLALSHGFRRQRACGGSRWETNYSLRGVPLTVDLQWSIAQWRTGSRHKKKSDNAICIYRPVNNVKSFINLCVHRAGGSGGAGGGTCPPTFWHRKKKGRRRSKKGKESVHPVPDRDVHVYMYNKISPSNCSKMYKTPELPGLSSAPWTPFVLSSVAQALPHNWYSHYLI